MNFENIKISDPHRLLPNLSDKRILKSSDKYVALSSLSIYYLCKKKRHMNIINLKHQHRHGMKSLIT